MKTEDEALVRWICSLPLRWALGGFLLGFVWSLLSSLLQGGFSNPIGGHITAWNSAEAISANITGVLGFTVLAAPVGAIVGALSRRTVKRYLLRQRVLA